MASALRNFNIVSRKSSSSFANIHLSSKAEWNQFARGLALAASGTVHILKAYEEDAPEFFNQVGTVYLVYEEFSSENHPHGRLLLVGTERQADGSEHAVVLERSLLSAPSIYTDWHDGVSDGTVHVVARLGAAWSRNFAMFNMWRDYKAFIPTLFHYAARLLAGERFAIITGERPDWSGFENAFTAASKRRLEGCSPIALAMYFASMKTEEDVERQLVEA